MKLRTAIVTATTAALLATSGVAIAGATGSSAPSTAVPPSAAAPAAHSPAAAPAEGRRFATGDRKARRLRIRRLVRGAGDVVTKAIGIDRPTLRKGLASGQTLAEIATANHVDPQVVIDALVNAAKTKLDAAVTAGKVSAERAARIEEKLPARVTKLVNTWHPKRLRDHAAS